MAQKTMDKYNKFPDLPAYQPPTTGWLSKIPQPCVPYIQLMRLDRPGGLTYFCLPHIYGTLHAAIAKQSPVLHLLYTNLVLFVGTVWLRGATCTWNDLVDADYDRQVARTRHRAIARGAVSVPAALLWIGVQSILAAACLLLLPPETATCTVPAIIGWVLYPLMKRVMDYPQVFLGFPMAWGVITAEAAIGATSLPQLLTGFSEQIETPDSSFQLSISALFLANAAWTLCYEQMYSYQDVAYDKKAGVRSLALLLPAPGPAKAFLSAVATLQVALLAATGHSLGFSENSLFFTGTVLGTAAALGIKLWNVNLDSPTNCRYWFDRGGLITGLAIMSGMAAEYVKLLVA